MAAGRTNYARCWGEDHQSEEEAGDVVVPDERHQEVVDDDEGSDEEDTGAGTASDVVEFPVGSVIEG